MASKALKHAQVQLYRLLIVFNFIKLFKGIHYVVLRTRFFRYCCNCRLTGV